MKVRSEIVELTAENYNEEQDILGAFPDAIWIKLDENRTKFYIKNSHRIVESFLVENGYR
jgi:hypothetical protein